jgi:tetratricopeptide (TPR) repeat protein
MPPRISLCLIAKNEEANLPACLQSAADVVDDIVVVDTGSTDRTRETAAGLGARVFDFAWVDSFAAARNESLRHATGEWILWLDGDERFDEANRPKLRTLVESLNGPAAYVMVQRSTGAETAGSATDAHQVRLFRNHPEVRWSYRVHEQILPGIRRAGHEVRFTDIAIAHTGYVDPALRHQKTERNLRLLHLEYAEQPDDPFTLFNLGWAYQELGHIDKALPLLGRSLERSQPGDSIVRKLYVLITHAHRRLGRIGEAIGVCRAGRARCPDDPELLSLEGTLLEELGDLDGAAALLRQLVNLRPGKHFASGEAGLGGPKVRHRLAAVLGKRGRIAEAETECRTLLAEQPDFAPAWLEWARLHLARGRWDEVEEALAKIPAESACAEEASVLRAQGCLARREFALARGLLEEAIARNPRTVEARVFLTRALLQEGHDLAAAERALREVLALDPHRGEAWRNLAVLLHQTGRLAEAVAVCHAGLKHCPADGILLHQCGLYLAESGDVRAAESCLVRFLEGQRAADGDCPARARQASARHQLALICHRQGRAGEAEGQWRAVLADQPEYMAAVLGLAELCLEQARTQELEELIGRLEASPEGAMEAAVLRARSHQAQRDFAAARQVLEETIARFPQAVWPRVTLSNVLFQEGTDLAAAERILREVLALEPNHRQTRNNLAFLEGRGARGQGTEEGRGDRGQGTEEGRGDRGQGTAEEQSPVTSLGRRQHQPSPLAPDRWPLRLAFVCFNPLPFHLDTPYRLPLGGSESSLCYLAEALAGRGHQVFVLQPGPTPASSRSVSCLPLNDRAIRQLVDLDAFIVLNLAGQARQLRALLAPQTALVLWTQHALDQPAVRPLGDPGERDGYDGFAFVSEWQRQEYLRHFGLDPRRTGVLKNGIAPAFQGLFPDDRPILAGKTRPPVLAYTSTPYRGLDLLLEAMAAGCLVVTSARGALPETSAGFARLVPIDGGRDEYLERFVAETVQALTQLTGPDSARVKEDLRNQVAHVHRQHTWPTLAAQWVDWLSRLRAMAS